MVRNIKTKKVVIWDLFGGGRNSVTKMLIAKNLIDFYDVFTFDVVPLEDGQIKHKNHHYLNCDLSVGLQKNISSYNIEFLKNGKKEVCQLKEVLTITDLFKKLLTKKIIRKPDIIVSSTLCQSFSKVLSMVGGGTCFWVKEDKTNPNSKLIERSLEDFHNKKGGFTKNLNPDKQLFIKNLGQKCADNSLELINYYQPKYWYIENPYSSLLWFYLRNNKRMKGFLNKCGLSNYGYPIDKTTGFFSNVEMSLLEKRIDKNLSNVYLHKKINNKEYWVRKGTAEGEIYDLLMRHKKKNNEKLLYFSKGKIYDLESDKKLTATNFYTYWEEVSKDFYDKLMLHVKKLLKKGSSGDRRVVKEENGKYYKRWYVEIGYSFGEKGHYSLKKTSITLGKLKKTSKYKNSSDFTTRQLSEATESSSLPIDALYHIFSHFK